jgi:hypothetical protein
MNGFSIRETIFAAAIVCVLVAWFIDRQVLHDALYVASSIMAAARER